MTSAEFAKLQTLRPVEAMAYMQGRAKVTPTHHYSDLWHDEHSQQFTVSRLTRADLLQAMHDSISKSVQGDMTRRDWIRNTETLLKDAGWWGKKEVINPETGEVLKTTFNHARLQLIYDTNSRQASATGQWQRMLRNQRTHPYARYISMGDDRVRPLHRAWNNVVLPLTDAWWETHRPPNGYRCRCRFVGMTQREYEIAYAQSRPGAETNLDAPIIKTALKKEAPQEAPVLWRNPSTGEVRQVPAGIDPGFDYNSATASSSRSAAVDAMVQSKLGKLTPAIADAARRAGLKTGLPVQEFTGQRPGLADVPALPVTALTGSEFGESLSHVELMTKATDLLRELQASEGLVNDDSGWLLAINRKGVKKMGDNMSQSRPSLQAIAALRALVRRAVVVERHGDAMHGNEFVNAIYRLLVPVQIDGQLYRVKLTVKDLQQGSDARMLLHALETAEIESAPLGTLPNSPASAGVGTAQPTTGRTVTIADLLRGAKLSDGQPFDL